VQSFRRETRQALESFLRFTHRYWFSEISDQAQTRDLFALCRRHLGLDRFYEDIRREVRDMSQYLENEAVRRQNETVVRLTVVTTFGLMGTVVTGFLGMNIFDWANESAAMKVLLFLMVFVPTIVLTLYTVRKSRRLSEFLDALADDTQGLAGKWRAFRRIW
jgi:Mg2+ and Co2+ transporter CorA